MSFSIERYKEESGKVDTSGIAWETVKDHGLSKGDLFCFHAPSTGASPGRGQSPARNGA
jgi:hypothetical protein